MRELPLVKMLSALEHVSALDGPSTVVTDIVKRVIRPQALRDLLHGVPAGHPLHPVLVMIPIGSWTSVALLDAVPGMRRPARLLVAAGLLGVGPAVASGFTDWSELHPEQKRVGLVHAVLNTAAAGLYLASFVKRGPSSAGSGRLLAMAGLGVVSLSGFLGGHLSYRQAAGANHVEDVPHLVPDGWHAVGDAESLPDGLTRRSVGDVPILIARRGDRIDAMADACSHLSGPLSDGGIVDVGGEACVECPWHGSRFALETGEVVQGPATAPQPRFETRVVDGVLEARIATPA